MTSLETVTERHARRQKLLAQRAATKLASLWRQLDPAHIGPSWRQLLPQALTVLSSAQAIAAASGGVFIDDALEAQGLVATAEGHISTEAFARIASDGRPLESLLFEPAISTLEALKSGSTISRARATGLLRLDIIARTQVADAGRAAESAAIAVRPRVGGYVRMLSLPSCSRCVILAGRKYKWNAGFRRHPRCDCRHIPVMEDTADALVTHPKKLFESMSEAEQNRVFTISGAQAIRDGADMNQVVNARRGAAGLSPAGARLTKDEIQTLLGGQQRGSLKTVEVFGQQLKVTTEGTTTRGIAGKRLKAELGDKDGGRYRRSKIPRLMPEQIYQIAGSNRAEAIRLLKRFGFII